MLDPFFEEKGYATSSEFSRFCAPTVPLARLKTRIFTRSDKFEIPVEISHYGQAPITAAASWKITDAAGRTLAGGNFDEREIPLGRSTRLGTITADPSKFPVPSACRLEVSGPGFANDWNFWVYPDPAAPPGPSNVEIHTAWPAARKSLAPASGCSFSPTPQTSRGTARRSTASRCSGTAR